MSIAKLTINGLRGFSNPQEAIFALPNGNPGSGLTFLVGENNSGKSTVIEALRYFAITNAPSFRVGQRNEKAGDFVQLRLEDESGVARVLRSVAAGTSETVWDDSANLVGLRTLVLPSRRHFAAYFGGGSTDRVTYADQATTIDRGQAVPAFAQRLMDAHKKKDDFEPVVKRIVGHDLDWSIDKSDQGQYFVKFKLDVGTHNSDGLGEGLISILYIADALYDFAPETALVIDEPELSLHPQLQRRLAEVLREYSKSRQIIIATHSPYLLDLTCLSEGAKVNRVYSRNNSSRLAVLSEKAASHLVRFLKDLNNPHLLGLDAREIFFLDDRVILVEGQEDVVFYKRILNELGMAVNGSFYGWGVGGESKMGAVCEILQDLQFEKVIGVLDGNVADRRETLEKAFPAFKFFTIPAADVRCKDARKAREAIEGLVDHKGVLRDKYRDAMIELISSFNEALH